MADLITSLAQSIQRFEGWAPGTVSYRNNNPGNLRSGPGQTGTDAQGYAIFPDYQTGWNALLNQVQVNVNRGLTLDEFFAGGQGYPGYAPAADSNLPYQYAATVGGWLGVDPSVPLNQLGRPNGGSQPIVDVTGDASTLPTPSILSQLSAAATSVGIDPTDPVTIVSGLAIAAALYFIISR
jgi:hypothetical protein